MVHPGESAVGKPDRRPPSARRRSRGESCPWPLLPVVVLPLLVLSCGRGPQGEPPGRQRRATDYTTGLVGHWRFDEGSGSSAQDTSGNGNDGTVYGDAIWSPGQRGLALSFDGTGDYVRVPYSGTSKFNLTGPMTVALWVYPTVPLTGQRRFVDRDGASSYYLGSGNGTNDLKVRLGGQTFVDTPDGVLALNRWQHVAFTYVPGGTVILYLDGVEIATGSYAGGIAGNPNDLFIGIQPDLTNGFVGKLDEVRIYSRALAAEDVAALCLAESVVGRWNLDEGSGIVALDSSGNGNDGVLAGGATRTAGKFGGGVNLHYQDGSDYVTIANSPSLENVQEGSFTVAAWFKPSSDPPNNDPPNNDPPNNNTAAYAIVKKGFTGLTYGPCGKFSLHHWLAGGAVDPESWPDLDSPCGYPPGVLWYHAAGVLDRRAGIRRVYVNGQLVAEDTFTPGAAEA